MSTAHEHCQHNSNPDSLSPNYYSLLCDTLATDSSCTLARFIFGANQDQKLKGMLQNQKEKKKALSSPNIILFN